MEDTVPEFSFENATFTRTEDSKVTMEMSAARLEQYKGGNSTYAQDVEFTLYDDGKVTTQGSCGFLGADSSAEIYNLHDDIYLDSPEKEVKVHARNLKWDGKTEQLTSGRSDSVTVETDTVKVIGSGFSASGVSSSFSFSGIVSGDITQEDKQEEGE